PGRARGPECWRLGAAWRRGDDVFAEIGLPASIAHQAADFHLHPALLDPAFPAHALPPRTSSDPMLLFSWAGVSLRSAGASALRVHLFRNPSGSSSRAIANASGAPIAFVEALLTRPASADQIRGALATHDASI